MRRKLPRRSASKRLLPRLRLHRYKAGAAPGALDGPDSDPDAAESTPAQTALIRYDRDAILADQTDIDITACRPPAENAVGVYWVHIRGTPTVAQLQQLGQAFSLHPLALEDVQHQEARAKTEAYEAQQFIVLHYMRTDSQGRTDSCQISFFLGRGYLISIDSGASDMFAPVHVMLRSASSKLRQNGADYLLYTLLDQVVDSGFPLLEVLGDTLEDLEDEILDNPDHESRNKIHYAKRQLAQMRRTWWPQREVIATLMRDNDRQFSKTTRLYLRDCYDHCVILIDFVESYRDTAASLLDIYLSAVTQRMNDIMKALTIIATIFLPLTFLTGLYGMNFNTDSPWNMPELNWRYGYFYVLGVMSVVAVVMLAYFRRKRWL